jgi:biotin carboxylase
LPVPSNPRVLVVGTTADYIDWIRKSSPECALFLTEPGVRRGAHESCPAPAEEILCNLCDYDQVRRMLKQHLLDYGLSLGGVACYDCESMDLAAVLAREFGLPYPSAQTVKNCRDKYRSKILWRKHGLQTPRVKLIRSATEVADIFRDLGGACVLKPLSGSGSELIFRCEDVRGCEQGFMEIQQGLQQRRENRLYASFLGDDPVILAEALVRGDEYSCDFVIENGRADVIRLTRKILSSNGPFGTALGYLLPGDLPPAMDKNGFLETLVRSAHALEIERAVCMLDFIVHEGQIHLLELAPRPGGDCLPFLLRHCLDLDILKLFLDFSRGRSFHLNKRPAPFPCIGLRLHAGIGGTLKKIDAEELKQDTRVAEVNLKRRPGHRIQMPPADYDSWILGHVIFHPDGHSAPQVQCRELLEKLKVDIE